MSCDVGKEWKRSGFPMRETIQNANGKQFHAVSLSGGKDSTAMLLLMIERDMPIDMVLSADTGMEFPEMYEHLAKLDEHLFRERGIHINPHGKMTVKQLAAKDKGLQSIEVTDQNIGSFNRIARKYGIDFAPFKVKGEKRYMVFFKAPDADAMTAAFKEYTAKQVRKAERPSVLEKLQHFKSLIQAAVVDRAKRKELER